MTVPVQRRLPRRRSGHMTAVTIGGERFYCTANGRADGSLGEVSAQWGKAGSAGAGLMDTYAVALSVGLQHNVPLADLLRPALGLCFVPAGPTDDPEIPQASSVVDYFARRLALDWLPYAERTALGVFAIAELAEQTRRQRPAPAATSGSDRRALSELATPVGSAR